MNLIARFFFLQDGRRRTNTMLRSLALVAGSISFCAVAFAFASPRLTGEKSKRSAALAAPKITVSPDSLAATLLTGGVATQKLQVRNIGDGDLNFSVSDVEVEAGGKPELQFLANLDYPVDASNVWGYSAPDGTELAIIGHLDGTSFVEVSTDPSHPKEVAFIPGPQSIWREIKTYSHYAYIVTEGGGGLQIVDLADPMHPVLAATYSASFSTAHTIYIDASGFAYIMGSNVSNGGLHILSLANPTRPAVAGNWSNWYVHDGFERNNTFYAASIFNGTLDFLNVSNKANPTLLKSHTYPGAFTHNVWLTEDSKYALTTDERAGGFVNIWDIQDLNAIELVAQYRVNSNHIPHNIYVKDHYAYLSAYVDGVVVLDISNPASPTVVGKYDTYPGDGGIFAGAWGVYPFARNGLVYVSDIQTGLYVLRFGPNWLHEAPTSWVLSPEGGMEVTATFDASGLAGGDYFADVLISSNDPEQAVLRIPAHLKVTGAPDIALSDTLLDFGAVFVPYEDTLTLVVSNQGVEPLIVSDISSDQPNFTVDLTSFNLSPGQRQNVPIIFSANAVGDFSGSLALTSNDPDETVAVAALRGTAVRPPEISVTPDSLSAALVTGERATQLLKIENSGASELSFEISVEKAAAFVAHNGGRDMRAKGNRKIPPSAKSLNEELFSFKARESASLSPRFDNPYTSLTALLHRSLGRRMPAPRSLAALSQQGALFAVDGSNNRIVELNPATGEFINSFPALGTTGGPDGLAYDGKYLYLKTSSSDTLYQIDKSTGQVINRAFISGLFAIDGLAHSGEALYAVGYNSGTIYKINFATATIVDQFTFGFSIGGGITFGGSRNTLFVADFSTTIFEIDPEDWSVRNSFALPASGTTLGLGYSEGLGILFIGNVSDGTIYAVDPDDGAVTFSFPFGYASALAADEAYGVSWLSCDPASGIVPAGASLAVSAIFDATGLNGGVYDANVIIRSNDPDEPALVVSAHLKVTGAPDISTKVDSLHFGVRFVGYGEKLDLVVANQGTDVLEISAATIDNSAFSALPASLSIPPRGRDTLAVSFLPATVGDYNGTLTLVSNDPDEGVFMIGVAGRAIEPPIAAVAPDSLSASLFVGDSTKRVLTLTNAGGSDLVFQIGAVEITPPPRNATTTLIPPENRSRYTWAESQKLWHNQNAGWSSGPESESGGGAPGRTTASATQQFWRLLYTDPDESELTYDIRHAYGAVTDNEVLFRLQSHVGWSDPSGHGFAFIYIDVDQDTSTGINTERDGLGWFLGVDCAIFRSGDEFSDGFYRWNDVIFEFEKIDDLTTNIVMANSNETIVGVNRIHFEWRPAINFALQAGSFQDPGPDQVPDFGAGHILFPLSPRWLRFSLNEGVLPAGSREEIMVTLDASDIFGGDYNAHIFITSNDPAQPELRVAAHLSVTGIPAISLAADTVDFKFSFVGYKDSTYLKITNTGTDVLTIDNAVVADPRVIVSPHALSLRPLTSDSMTFYLLADNVGELASALSFTTNDPDHAVVSVPVKAIVVIAPDIAVTPAELSINVPQGGVATDTLTIANSGGSPLEYTTRISYESMGQAMQLDGFGDGLSVRNHAALNLQNSLTLELWLRPLGIPQDYPRIVSKGSISTSQGNYGAYEIALSAVAGQSAGIYPFATLVDANSREPYFAFSAREIALNTWTHLATTYDGTVFRLYVNGQLESEFFVTITVAVNNQILSIGKWFSGNFNSFWGEIDEVRVWSLARAQEEIQRQMFSPLDSSAPGLAGYWRFDADPFDASPFKHGVNFIGNAKLAPSTSPVRLDFLNVNPASGAVELNSAQRMAAIVNAKFLTQGSHHATIVFASNDPAHTQMPVPVKVQVGPPVSVEEKRNALPTAFALAQNYPNPFNPQTSIHYALPVASEVQLIIYDLHGRVVIRLVEQKKPAGFHVVHWDGRDVAGAPVASGVYLYRLTAGRFSQVKKAILLK